MPVVFNILGSVKPVPLNQASYFCECLLFGGQNNEKPSSFVQFLTSNHGKYLLNRTAQVQICKDQFLFFQSLC